MVEAAHRTGKLLQIGNQRRSNPLYILCCEKLLGEANLLGQVTAIYGQWNRSRAGVWVGPRAAIRSPPPSKSTARMMHQFRNWRSFKGLGGGPIVDLGSHQIDIYNWFLGARPVSVLASGRHRLRQEEARVVRHCNGHLRVHAEKVRSARSTRRLTPTAATATMSCSWAMKARCWSPSGPRGAACIGKAGWRRRSGTPGRVRATWATRWSRRKSPWPRRPRWTAGSPCRRPLPVAPAGG